VSRDLRRFSGARRLEVIEVDAAHDVYATDAARRACLGFLRRAEAT